MSISSVAKAHCRRPHGNAMVTPWQLRKSSDKQLTIDALFARSSVRLIKLDFFAYSTKTFKKENEEKRLYYRRVPLLTRVYLPQIFRKRNNILKWCGRQAFSGSCFGGRKRESKRYTRHQMKDQCKLRHVCFKYLPTL